MNRRLFLLLLIISLVNPYIKAAENLLINPDFELGNTTGWTDWGCDLTATQDQVFSGNYSAFVSNRTQSWQGPVQSLLGVLEDGKTYTISGWVRLENSPVERFGITISQTYSDGTKFTAINFSNGYNDQWIFLSGTFTLNVTGNLTGLDVYFEGPAPGVNFYVDDAKVLYEEPPQPTAAGIVDVNTVYQELEGFGAAGAWYEGWLTAHPLKEEIYDIIFGQLGLDIYRLRNTYEISSSNIIDSAEIVEAAELSLGYPIKILISSWSPPAYLKSNSSTVGGTLNRSVRGGGYRYDRFAQWWADSLEEYAGYGIDANYISIQNEPDFLTTDWDTCKFTPTETEEWAGYDLAFEAVHQELNSRMTEANMPKLLAPEACGCGSSKSYIDALIDPNHAYGYAHHLYADGNFDNPKAFIPALINFGTKYKDKPLFQTEYSAGSEQEQFIVGLNQALQMHNSLVHEGASSYFYWNLFWGEEGGLVSLDNPWQSDPNYTINPTYYAFKHYSAFTDPNWHRVEASTDSSGLRISAFTSPDANELTIVLINISEIDIDLTLSFENFSPDDSAIYRTSETEHFVYIGTFEQSQPLELPAQTITTISLIVLPEDIEEEQSEENLLITEE